MPRVLRVVAVIATCALLDLAPPSWARPISKSWRRQDPRLEQRVTVAAPRLYVGDLLARLSSLSGVSIETGRLRDGTADERVTARLRECPLAEAMDALWSLLSYRGAEWHWNRTPSRGTFRYELIRPREAQDFARRLEEHVESDFLRHADHMLAAVAMSPEQRAQLARTEPTVSGLLSSERLRGGLKLFSEALSPETRAQVLRGERQVTVSVAQLSAEGKAFVQTLWARGAGNRLQSDGGAVPVPEPQSVMFEAARIGDKVSPSLYIHPEGMGGYGYLGGTTYEASHRQRVLDLWRLPGDASDHPHSGRAAREPEEPSEEREAARALERRLTQLSEGAQLNLLARLPRIQSDAGPPYGRKVKEYLEGLNRRAPYVHAKWRQGVLLLSYPAWFMEAGSPGERAPWLVVRELKAAEERGKGILSLKDLARAASVLTEPQLRDLEDEYPAMVHVAAWRDLFVLLARSRRASERLVSPEGIAVAELQSVLPDPASRRLREVLQNPRAAALRLTGHVDRGQEPATAAVRLEVLSSEGRVIGGGGFTYRGRPSR